MDKLNKIGLTALAGVLSAATAQAADVSISGGAGFTYATADTTEVTGNRLSMGDSLTFTVSGETDQGWSVTHSIEIDGGAMDDHSVTIDMGEDMGAIAIQDSGAKGTPPDLVPNAYGTAAYSMASASVTGKHVADGLGSGSGEINLGYTNSVGGFDLGIGTSMGAAANGTGSEFSMSVTYADILEGLTVGVGFSDINQGIENGGIEEESWSVKYVVGGITMGYTDMSADDQASGGTDYDGIHYGISFAVNDDLTVSYGVSESDKSGTSVDEEISSLQASYTMGNMTVKGHISNADNEQFSSGAEDEAKAIDVSWAF